MYCCGRRKCWRATPWLPNLRYAPVVWEHIHWWGGEKPDLSVGGDSDLLVGCKHDQLVGRKHGLVGWKLDLC